MPGVQNNFRIFADAGSMPDDEALVSALVSGCSVLTACLPAFSVDGDRRLGFFAGSDSAAYFGEL